MGRQCRSYIGYDSFIFGDPSGTWAINFGNVSSIPMVFNVVILYPHGYFGQSNVLGMPDKTLMDR